MLRSSLDFAENHIGLFLVLLGVAGEVFFDWRETKGPWAKTRKAFAAILVLGLILDFSDAAKSDQALAEINARAAKAEKEAGDANERAAKFDAARANIEKEAENIQASNLALQAKVLELQGKMRPRTISPDKKSELLRHLTACPKGKVFILASIFDAEATNFAAQLEDVFKSAGFDVVRPALPNRDAVISVGSVGLHILVKDQKQAPAHARPIQKSFYESGIPLEGQLGGPDFDADRVEIDVGQHL